MSNHTTNDQPIILVPDDIEALLDEATGETPYSAIFTNDSVQLVETVGHKVIREIPWADARQFAANLRMNIFNQDIRSVQ